MHQVLQVQLSTFIQSKFPNLIGQGAIPHTLTHYRIHQLVRGGGYVSYGLGPAMRICLDPGHITRLSYYRMYASISTWGGGGGQVVVAWVSAVQTPDLMDTMK